MFNHQTITQQHLDLLCDKMKIDVVTLVFCIISSLRLYAVGYPNYEYFECKSGQEFIENDCNKCYCLNNSELVCRIRRCEFSSYKELKNCRTGLSWWQGCHKCWCANVGTVCTKKCY